MTQPDIIQTILKDSNYRLDLFDEDEIQTVRERISIIVDSVITYTLVLSREL